MRNQSGAPDGENSTSGDDERREVETTSPAEWFVAGLGCLLVLLALGWLTFFSLAHPSGPPDPVVDRLATRRLSGGFVVGFKVRNLGNSTAAGLLVAGELRNGDAVVEESEATLDYVPSHSERDGGLFFTRDPEQFDLQLRAKGYSDP